MRHDLLITLTFLCASTILTAFTASPPTAEASELNLDDMDDMDILLMPIEELMEIPVYSSTKSAQPLSATPGSVTVLSYEQIQLSGASTLPELLRTVAGVNVRWNPMAETIDIRGFGENPLTNRVLLLIDGVPYNSQSEGGFPQHIGFDFFNLENVKQVEVIRGGGSSLYGENAYWGIVNIQSLSGRDLKGSRFAIGGGDRNTSTASVMAGSEFENGDWLVSAKLLETQLPHEFWYKENDADYQGRDLFLKLNYDAFTFSYYRHEAENEGFQLGFTNGAIPNSAFISDDLVEEKIDIISVKYEDQLSEHVVLNSNLSYTQRHGSQCSACHAAQQYPDATETGDHGQQFIVDSHILFSGLDRHQILAGIEYRSVDAGDDRTELIDPNNTVDEPVLEYDKYALYLQDQINLLDNKLSLLLGIRYDGETDPDLFDDNLSPRIATVYKVSDRVKVKASLSQSFHFPDFSTMYYSRWFLTETNGVDSVGSIVSLANHDLEPEKITNLDLGLSWVVNERLSANFSLFQSKLDKFIVMAFRNNFSGTIDEVIFENHPGDATLRGGEIELNYIGNDYLQWYLNLAFQDNSQDDDEVDTSLPFPADPVGLPIEFSYSPERKVNGGVRLKPYKGFSGSIEFQWKDEYYAPTVWYLGRRVTPLDDYTLLHIQLSYHLPSLLKEDDELVFTVKGRNLLDETPEETLLGLNNKIAGREFFWGVEYTLTY